MHRRLRWVAGAWLAFASSGCNDLKAVVVENYPNAWDDRVGAAHAATPQTEPVQPLFDGADVERPHIPVGLSPLITGLDQPTDIQFPPGHPDMAFVAEKEGRVRVFSVAHGTGRELTRLLSLESPNGSEQGVLGLAFHPAFGARGGRLYVHHTVEAERGNAGRISVTEITVQGETWSAGTLQPVLELDQPYANHNGGQLQFGPDRMLYIGFGDGGWRNDPHGHGQNASTWLGSILRIDVDTASPQAPRDGRSYGIPADNPFLDQPTARPETWAIGLRNPWRFSFAPDGRMVVGDVGQNRHEEVSIVGAGDNMGWKIREANQCFSPKSSCRTEGLVDPIYTYDHARDGASITGGYVYTGTRIPTLTGKYVFGDFTSGRVWALDLPATVPGAAPVSALGRFEALISSFGRDARGELLLADFGGGVIYRLVAAGT